MKYSFNTHFDWSQSIKSILYIWWLSNHKENTVWFMNERRHDEWIMVQTPSRALKNVEKKLFIYMFGNIGIIACCNLNVCSKFWYCFIQNRQFSITGTVQLEWLHFPFRRLLSITKLKQNYTIIILSLKEMLDIEDGVFTATSPNQPVLHK